jgi:NAD+ kinase
VTRPTRPHGPSAPAAPSAPAPIRAIGVGVNPLKARAAEIVDAFLATARRLALPLLLPAGVAPSLPYPHLSEEDLLARSDALVVFGGDGTLLWAARRVAPRGIPILGVDVGTLGFLTEAAPEDLETILKELIAGRAHIEERIHLEGRIERGGRVVAHFNGLNDVVVGRGALSRLVRLETTVGGEAVSTYHADGLIVATPTGSTAYALSAGGPIVHPTLRVLLAIPICPHTLTVRPLVIAEDDEVRVRLEARQGQEGGLVTVDGQETHALADGDLVIVRRAPFVTRLVVTGRRPFYGLLRRKFRWGEPQA